MKTVGSGLTVTTLTVENWVTGDDAESVIPTQYELEVVGETKSEFVVPVSEEYVASTFAESPAQLLPEGPVYHFAV